MAKFSFFSFDWLGSKERKKLEKLRKEKEQRELKEQFDKEQMDQFIKTFDAAHISFENLKPFKSCRLIGETVLVVLHDGTTLSKEGAELLGKVRQAQSEDEIIELFTVVHKKEPDASRENQGQKELVSQNLEIFKGHVDFEIKDEEVYLKGVNLALPPVVCASFIELLEKLGNQWEILDEGCESCESEDLEEKYEALKMFWLKLCLNGREESREDLLAFCLENDVRITQNGNLILYRNIVSLGHNKAHTEFVSQQYFKVKGQKKSPKNYWVWQENDRSFKLTTQDLTSDGIGINMGNLYNLYQDLSNHPENKFTSWNSKGKYEIKIGTIYKIEEDEIDLDNGVCHSGGLHAANVNYDYSGYGDTPVVVLVSPSKAITVPLSDRGKLRTTEMFICCINDKSIGEHFSEEDLSAFDEEYNHYSIEELEESLEEKSFGAIGVKNEVSPLTVLDMENVKNMLKGRIVEI